MWTNMGWNSQKYLSLIFYFRFLAKNHTAQLALSVMIGWGSDLSQNLNLTIFENSGHGAVAEFVVYLWYFDIYALFICPKPTKYKNPNV